MRMVISYKQEVHLLFECGPVLRPLLYRFATFLFRFLQNLLRLLRYFFLSTFNFLNTSFVWLSTGWGDFFLLRQVLGLASNCNVLDDIPFLKEFVC